MVEELLLLCFEEEPAACCEWLLLFRLLWALPLPDLAPAGRLSNPVRDMIILMS